MKKSEIAAALSVIIAIVVINSIGIEKILPEVKIFTLVLAPIFVLWIILKYKKSKEQQKYTIIIFITFIITFYIGALVWIMDTYYHQYYNEYRNILAVLLIVSFIVMTITAIVGKKLIDRDEALNKRNKKYK